MPFRERFGVGRRVMIGRPLGPLSAVDKDWTVYDKTPSVEHTAR
jgi:hypothetical protein